jgi:hypothetical protein
MTMRMWLWVGAFAASTAFGEPKLIVTAPEPPQVTGEGIDLKRLANALSGHRHEVELCFQKEWLRGAPIDGFLRVAWKLDSDGKAVDARLIGSNGAEAVTQCVLQRIAAWSFQRPPGPVTVRYGWYAQTVDVSRGNPSERESIRDVREAPTAAPVSPTAVAAESCQVVAGALGQATLSGLMHQHHVAFNECLDSASTETADQEPDAGLLARTLDSLGSRGARPSLEARWAIDATASTGSVEIFRAGVRAPRSERCLADALKRFTFPRVEARVRCVFIGQ